ncbi:MAG: hypothetical protein AB7I27_08965 [Bacteriovoracaceae bacterium]
MIIPLLSVLLSSSVFAQLLSPAEVEEAKIEYEEIVERVNKVYKPIFAKNSYKLKFWSSFNEDSAADIRERHRMWLSPGDAGFDGKQALVSIRGTLTALDHMTKDAGMIIACHEIGHLIGGAPMNPVNEFIGWTSREGQADYYVTTKCLRKLWQDDQPVALNKDELLSESLWNKCLTVYADKKEQYVCQRSLNAIAALSKTTYYSNSIFDFDHLSSLEVEKTVDKYPDDQCRMEIMIAGAFCNKSGRLSRLDPTQGTCAEENGDTVGVRPRCFYKPMNENELKAVRVKKDVIKE